MTDTYQRTTQGKMVNLAKVLPLFGVLNAFIAALLQRYWSSVRASIVLQVCFAFIAISSVVSVAVYVVVFTSAGSFLRTLTSSASETLRKLANLIGRIKVSYVTFVSAAATIVLTFILTICRSYLTVLWCALIGFAVGSFVLYFVCKIPRVLSQQMKPGNDDSDLCQDCQIYNQRLETNLQRELTAISTNMLVRLMPDDMLEGACNCKTPGNGAVRAKMTAHVICNGRYVIDTAYVDGDGNRKYTWVRLPSRLASELCDDFLRCCFVSQPAPATESVWALLSGCRCLRLLLNSLSCSQTTTSGAVLIRTVSGPRGYRDYEIKFRIALEYRFVKLYSNLALH